MKKILVVGQTPPPYHGQAMMINRLVSAKFHKIKIYHIRVHYSSSLKSIGGFSFNKVFHLFYLIYKTIFYRFKYGVKILYYPPAGPNLTPILRDWIFLCLTRPFFKKTIFHFRAAGISEYLSEKNRLLTAILKLPYQKPDLSIHLSGFNPKDGQFFHSKNVKVIYNGIEDNSLEFRPIIREQEYVNLLYIGSLNESKGVFNLLEATKILKDKGYQFAVNLVGDFLYDSFKKKCTNYIEDHALSECVKFHGVLTGLQKWNMFIKSDVLCFPTYYESESFGNVLLEAMMFEMVIIASRWRGVQEIIRNGVNGILVEPKNSDDLAKAIEAVLEQKVDIQQLTKNARNLYLNKFTLEHHLNSMENTLYDV